MQIKELRDRLKTQNTDGVFLFCGDEDYLKRYYLHALRKQLVPDAAAAAFSHFVYEGDSMDMALVRDAVLTPCMTESKLCEWHMLDIDAMKDKELEDLEDLCQTVRECPGNTLLLLSAPDGFDPGTERRPGKLVKRLSSFLNIVNFERSTNAQLISWIGRHFSAEGVAISQDLPEALLLKVGHSMGELASEIDKLICYAKANDLSTVTEKELSLVAISTVESDAFSLSNAMLDGRTQDAFRYLGDLKRRRVEPILILGQLSRLYGDMLTVALLGKSNLTPAEISRKLGMHEYKVGLYIKSAKRVGIPTLRRTLSLCRDMDNALKNGNASYGGLERLVAQTTLKAGE